MDSSQPSSAEKDLTDAEKKQAFKEGAMDNTGKLPDAAQQATPSKKEIGKDTATALPPHEAP